MSARDAQTAERIRDNLAAVRASIAAAAARSGRQPGDVTLVGITKYVDSETTACLADAGLEDLGESRPQALWSKAAALAPRKLRWHLVGHLQRNKVERTLPLAALLHSVDSLRLLEAIDRAAGIARWPAQVLLEVNVSGDAAKQGFAPQEVSAALAAAASLEHVQVQGLMTMAALEGGTDRARRDFAALRTLRDRLLPDCPPNVALRELSMGMSGDFEVAIEEGSTIVRVGSALFEGLDEPA